MITKAIRSLVMTKGIRTTSSKAIRSLVMIMTMLTLAMMSTMAMQTMIMKIIFSCLQIFDSLDRAMQATEHAATVSRQAVKVFQDQASSLQACKRMLENLMQTSRTA